MLTCRLVCFAACEREKAVPATEFCRAQEPIVVTMRIMKAVPELMRDDAIRAKNMTLTAMGALLPPARGKQFHTLTRKLFQWMASAEKMTGPL